MFGLVRGPPGPIRAVSAYSVTDALIAILIAMWRAVPGGRGALAATWIPVDPELRHTAAAARSGCGRTAETAH